MSSRLARARKEKGEKKKEEDGSRCREEARRDEYVDFMAKGLKRAFDLDRRRSASPRERQDPPRERSPRRPRQEERPVEVPPGLLPPTGPVDKNSGALNINNGPVDNFPGPPADMIPARLSSHNGACPSTHPQAPPAAADEDVEMAPLPPSPTYLQVPLPASSSPAKSQ
ncbi:hypothetical protein PENSOL_c009G07884 [Penicillium solitum]|uniref:Uncharacterized protein n=1 Tax=Penicillium solitum TaxID=60172 RepID=A0A1V6RAQ1_9EURO|nr:uncharacterized protein PENSOL_c009G07884 [Penicillium solitum]OQD98363.1 hypothetical protein PENSOL_c009G07884 [Penicillium solitum]